jgi:chorismate synthase
LASPRREEDRVRCLSGVFEDRTTGAPICLVVENRDADPSAYEPLKDLFRPGHADLTYQGKYGIRDWRGGGRSSGRETVARVAAGALARHLLAEMGVEVVGFVNEIGGIPISTFDEASIEASQIRCPDPLAEALMVKAIKAARDDGDSVGGIVEVRARGVPCGWGDPVFGKLDGALALALMSIGAVKGVEIGDGFALARVRGSESNDELGPEGFLSNRQGGVLGGISSGAEIVVRAAVKPTPSIAKGQQTIDRQGRPTKVEVKGRHDPCICPRLVPVAEAMVCLVLIDAALRQRTLIGGGRSSEPTVREESP